MQSSDSSIENTAMKHRRRAGQHESDYLELEDAKTSKILVLQDNGVSMVSSDNAHPEITKGLCKRIQVLVRLFPVKSVAVLVAVGIVLVVLSGESVLEIEGTTISATKDTSITPKRKNEPRPFDSSWFENCTISYLPPAKKATWTTKPLWLSQYPDSLDEATSRNLVNGLTCMEAGAKSYYASSSTVKRCKSTMTETATCSSVHPVIDMRGGPEGLHDEFHQDILLILRNPRFALAAHPNGKRIRYHHKEGQIPLDEWRVFRDEWLKSMMEDWKKTLKAWVGADGYKVGMYIVVEHLLDIKRGPDVAKRLATVLQNAGFPTAPSQDISCIWYQAMGRDLLERIHKFGYEYEDYTPGYTQEQLNYLMSELSQLMEEYKWDKELVFILQEYHDDIRDNAVPDNGPGVNQSTTT